MDNLNKSLWPKVADSIWSIFRDYYVIILVINIILNFIISPYVFDNEYSYENILLKSAVPVEEEEIIPLLIDSYNKVRLSSLFDSNTEYIVYLSNSTKSDFLYFKMVGFVWYIKELFLPVNISTYEGPAVTIPRMAGYVWAGDIFGLSYVDYPDTHVIAHELAHQIVQKSINNPLLTMISCVKDNDIHEGYANLIAFGGVSPSYEPDFYSISNSESGSFAKRLHSDGKYYYHVNHTLTFTNNEYFKPYSYSNAFIIQQILEEQTILELLSSLDSRHQIKTANYNYLESKGFVKQDNIGSLKGSWIKSTVTPAQ